MEHKIENNDNAQNGREIEANKGLNPAELEVYEKRYTPNPNSTPDDL